MRVSLEFDAQPVVVDPQVAVLPARDRFGRDRLHLLRHHTDISSVAAVITKPVETKTIVETAEQSDIVLERDVGSPATTAASTAATTAAPHPAATTTTATATRSHTTATAAHARASTRGRTVGAPAGTDVP